MLATSHLFWSAVARPSASRWWLLGAVTTPFQRQESQAGRSLLDVPVE